MAEEKKYTATPLLPFFASEEHKKLCLELSKKIMKNFKEARKNG